MYLCASGRAHCSILEYSASQIHVAVSQARPPVIMLRHPLVFDRSLFTASYKHNRGYTRAGILALRFVSEYVAYLPCGATRQLYGAQIDYR